MASIECEMCGKKTAKTTKIRVDGAILNVCDDCARFGKPVDAVRSFNSLPTEHSEKPKPVTMPEKPRAYSAPLRSKPVYRKPKEDLESMDIDPDYAIIIKEAREKLSWTQEELAKKLQERKNVVSSIERGELMPDIRIARKMEKLLEVKLIQKA
ncbi:MAG: multiprotein bridging factor aMBF1 [Candidatus Thermoplasmatota archaeon]|jgi:putative transcription factor|nr:multiprotein bridging factor aMBF1 [Candidatus Thermoplasmatota archaeon]MCL5668307.1 multiprotein bridging factor aMBF1 [Candidatus Thermoplasmatota archaeon]